MSVTLFSIAEVLHRRAKQWKPGGNWCLIRYGKWTFYRVCLADLFLSQVCKDFLQLWEELCSLWRRLRCSVAHKVEGRQGKQLLCLGGLRDLVQIATGIDTGFGKRFCPCKDQQMGSKHSPTCSLPAVSQVAPCTWLTWRLKGSWTLYPSRNGNFCAHSCSTLSTGFVRWVELCLQALGQHWWVALTNTNLRLQGCNCWRKVLLLGNLLWQGLGDLSVIFSSLSFILYPVASRL